MGVCKYPNEVCINMTMLNGDAYCDSTFCVLNDDPPAKTNGDYIRGLSDEKIAELFDDLIFECSSCFLYTSCRNYRENSCIANFKEWLKQPHEEEDF